MKSLLLLPALLGLAFAHPAPELDPRAAPQIAHFYFQAAATGYNLTVPADGNWYPTNNGLNVNIITALDFTVTQCEFATHQQVAFAYQLSGADPYPKEQFAVGPPQPIDRVRCHGYCLQIYQDCYKNGQFVGSCCNGFCAANKCRPYVYPQDIPWPN
ncbi:hypothetical protein B0H65DRAFT_414648 [Neurospora tetraspora]|uniref:Uncharacterized protein n=1 Tax=Neurospora tetraspora TaxID=94610 RepID=A0AAE0MWY7_9PEZI|nr:hypothetical protein B0H65DRAFT_414648 [Neurospora tetraspora]